MERKNQHPNEKPVRLESARQSVVAGVSALGDLPTAAGVRAQQALIIAGLERLSDGADDAACTTRDGSEWLWREKWIDELPCTD